MRSLNRTILMIDDDTNALELAKKIIDNVGYNFISAKSLKEAHEQIKTHAPHMIILDVRLDGEDGFAFLNDREKSDALAKIPVLILTNLKQDKLLQQVLSYKGADFLQKPIHQSLLLQKIKKNLKTVETKSFKFTSDQRPAVTITINGEIDKISEVALLVQSAIKFNSEDEISVKAQLLDELKITSSKMMIKKNSTSGIEGGYNTEVVLRGVTEESAQQIRKIRRVRE